MKAKVLKRCEECGSMWEVTVCLKSKKPICRSCCDVDCSSQYSCWGRYY